MIAKLLLMDRFTLIDLVPKKSEFIMLKQYRALKEKLALQQDEVPKYKVKIDNDGNLSFDRALDLGVEFEFSDLEIEIIRKELRLLDEKRQLEDKHYSIYDKFMNNR